MSCPWEGDGRCENPVFQKLDKAQAEVVRLRADVRRLQQDVDGRQDHIEHLRAEVERLRGLLRRSLPFVGPQTFVSGSACDLARDIEEALRG